MRFANTAIAGMILTAFYAGQTAARESSPTKRAYGKTTSLASDSTQARRTVRGQFTEHGFAGESAELRTVREFESRVFPGHILPSNPNFESDEEVKPLPPGLTGRWGGSGDIPANLRSPERQPIPALPPGKPEWLRTLQLPEIPMRWEPQVFRYLEFFKDDLKGRAIMTVWLRRMGRYRPIIEKILDREGLPKDLIYLAMVESGFDPGAISPKAAGGIWQFIPGAARAYGLEVSHWVDARRDPERSTEAAARYLKDLYIRFGTWHLAFAAYNAGYGAVLKSIARFNTNDFWELVRHEAGMPWETSLYVPKILAAAIIGHNPAAFGFTSIIQDAAVQFDRVEVPSGTSFAALAKTVGTQVEVIESLNPEYVRGRIPPDRERTILRVPVGAAALFTKAALSDRDSNLETVTLRFGETLEDVAKARGIAVRELRRINGATENSELRGGATILVPARSVSQTVAVDDAEEPILVALPDRTFYYADRERVFYRTRDGDTTGEIAGIFDVTIDDIVEWNNIDPDANLQAKLVLQLFVRQGFDRRGVVLLDPDSVRVVTLGSEEFSELETARRGKTRLYYAARPGDTLAKIAKRYGLSAGDLARINRLSAAADLNDGQKIVVYSPSPEMPKEITARASVKRSVAVSKRGKTTASNAGKVSPARTLVKPSSVRVSVQSKSSRPTQRKASSGKR
jgi:membrane-bound lytic murein transglycosylase D